MTPRSWNHIRRLFNGALRLARSQRGAYLRQHCRNEAVRKDVESLLAQHDKAENFMGIHSSVGKVLSHYEVLEQIGFGGMALVYKARDTRLNRLVAIKVLPAWAMGDPVARQRLREEAKCASALNHPNIVTIHAIAEENGVDFIVMEYVSGNTLDHCIPPRGLSVDKTIRHALPIAEALATAHAAGILHWDLKPSNIMLTEDGRVKLLDFGLARALAFGTGGPETAPTSAHFGTKAYMAPEQLRDRARDPDPRAEVFSFGLVLYQMISGRHAFGPGSRDQLAEAIQNKKPKDLPPKVPAALAKLIFRCLEKSSHRRFQSMQDVLVALRSCGVSNRQALLVAEDAPPKGSVQARRQTSRSAQPSRIPALLGRIGYTRHAQSREALTELTQLLDGALPKQREAVISVLKELILTIPDLNGNVIPAPIRKVRKAALDVLKVAMQGHLDRCFRTQEFEDLDLYQMNFAFERLGGFSFRGCFLVEASFQGSDLTGASFSGAYIRNVNLAEAGLVEADFTDADWFNALGLTEAQLKAVRPETLRVCPTDVPAMHGYLQARYGLPFEAWSAHVQEQLCAAWNEYLSPDGLRDFVAEFRRKP
jgi:serine/threonine protein kinase